MTMHSSFPRSSSTSGFTLVELLVAAMVMVFSALGSSSLLNQATGQTGSINRRLQEQYAISRDLAYILEMNERYSCLELPVTGECNDPTSISAGSPPPDQDEYAPAKADAQLSTTTPSFRGLCQQNLLGRLIKAIAGDAKGGTIPLTGKENAELKRVVSLDPAASSLTGESTPPHRYIVTWTDAKGRQLRQVQLTPTVAAWCP